VAHVVGLGHTRGRALCGALRLAATPALFPVLSQVPSSPIFSHTRVAARATLTLNPLYKHGRFVIVTTLCFRLMRGKYVR
jgi:hypothetical protein